MSLLQPPVNQHPGGALTGMSIAALLAWLAVERLYLNTQRANLLAQAGLLANALRSEAPPPAELSPYSQLSNTLPGIHTRVIDAQGAVVIDLANPGEVPASNGLALPQLAQNETGLVTPQELMSRPEIAQAWLGQPATAIRRGGAEGGRRVLYAAAPVASNEGNVVNRHWQHRCRIRSGSLPAAVRWQSLRQGWCCP
jgi:hypothetical protein